MSSKRLQSLAANPYKELVCAESTLLFLAVLWDCTSSILSKHCPKRASNTLPTNDSNSTDLLGEHVAETSNPPTHRGSKCFQQALPRLGPQNGSQVASWKQASMFKVAWRYNQQLYLKCTFLLHYLVKDLIFIPSSIPFLPHHPTPPPQGWQFSD